MLSVPYCFYRPKVRASDQDKQVQADEKIGKFVHEDGDHLTLINVYTEFMRNNESQDWCYKNYLSYRNIKSAVSIRDQLSNIMLRQGLKICCLPSDNALYSIMVRKSVLAGYFTQVAHRQRSGNYMVVRDNQVVAVHPGSLFEARPQFVVYHEIVLTTKNYIRTVSAIKAEWLLIEAPAYFNPQQIKNIETRKELDKAKKK